ncbi:hypothetical protein [Streptococcus suis]|uniref:hypothetical protein n=1 Tax=Streptococcus suis TaxID=1307 RepID=UPI0004A3C4D4|nr:hypothetical protein [Streptococcus suis]HEM3171378.1 hypothetical protein [Streptococcus suis]
MIEITNYNLYSDCIGNWYILTDDELSERDERPEYEECNVCGDTDEWHWSSFNIEDLAYYLKLKGTPDDVIAKLTGLKVYTKEVKNEQTPKEKTP